jgi:cyclophilin family peptidyl-prolyl cis-trans isomerase
LTLVVAALALVGSQVLLQAQQDDPVVAKIIQLGKTDNQVMSWSDYLSNRFGGRETGTNAYRDATEWLVWQFSRWGIEAHLEQAGELPVGFNRGPWDGRMTKPTEKALWFGTPSFTAGTKGVQRGGVVILKADPFSVPGRGPAAQTPENMAKKQKAVEEGIAEIKANTAAFKDKWVLIAGASTGFARDGRRGSPEYTDSKLIPALTKALVEAGALGTIQSAKPTMAAKNGDQPPLSILDGYVSSWEQLPVLPDIKLLDTQYNEIKAMVEKNQPVELEFDIRNWFKMGPIKYHNVVATIKGTTYPDEYIVIGGHFDAFSGATGGVDDGSGVTPMIETMRLIKAAGGKPKRSIVFIAFAAEESGLIGSQAWLTAHPELHDKIVMMVNRDGSPSAITGATVPETWYEDLKAITAPLSNVNAKWPFKLDKTLPRAHATSAGGTDSSSFEMMSVPTLNFQVTRDYPYSYAWHTTNDLYSEIAPYAEHQQHAALVTAAVVYGVANLEKPLTRAGVYLPDGLYADMNFGTPEKPRRVIVSLDFANAPIHAANFIRIIEGKPAAPGAAPARAMGGFGPGGAGASSLPPIGKLAFNKGGAINGAIVSDNQKAMAVAKLPKERNAALKHDAAGVFGMSTPNGFYFTTKKQSGYDGKFTALGKVVAGFDSMKDFVKDEPVRNVRIIRVGKAALDFKTDDEAFAKLLKPEAAKRGVSNQ